MITAESKNLRVNEGEFDTNFMNGSMGKLTESGAELYTLTDAEIQVWRDDFKPLLESYIKQLEKDGVKDAQDLYDAVVEKVANYK